MPGYFSNYIRTAREKNKRTTSLGASSVISHTTYLVQSSSSDRGSSYSLNKDRPASEEALTDFELKLYKIHRARDNAFKITESLQSDNKKNANEKESGNTGRKDASIFNDQMAAMCEMSNEEYEEYEKEREQVSHFRFHKLNLVDRNLMAKIPSAKEMVVDETIVHKGSDRLLLKNWLKDYEALQKTQLWTADGDRESITSDVLSSLEECHYKNRAYQRSNERLIAERDPIGDSGLSKQVQYHLNTLKQTSELEDALDGVGKKMRDISARIKARHEELEEKLKNVCVYQQRMQGMTLSQKIEELKLKLSAPDFKDSVEASRQLVIGQALASLDKAKAVVNQKKKVITTKRHLLQETKAKVDDLRQQMEMKTRRTFHQKEEEEKRKEAFKNEMTDFILLSSFFLKEIDGSAHSHNNKGKSVFKTLSSKISDIEKNDSPVAILAATAASFHNKFKAETRRKSTVQVDHVSNEISRAITTITQSCRLLAYEVHMVQVAKDDLRSPLLINRKDVYEKQSRMPRAPDMWPEFIQATCKVVLSACAEFVPVVNYLYSAQVEENKLESLLYTGPMTIDVCIFDMLHPVKYDEIKTHIEAELKKMGGVSRSSRKGSR